MKISCISRLTGLWLELARISFFFFFILSGYWSIYLPVAFVFLTGIWRNIKNDYWVLNWRECSEAVNLITTLAPALGLYELRWTCMVEMQSLRSLLERQWFHKHWTILIDWDCSEWNEFPQFCAHFWKERLCRTTGSPLEDWLLISEMLNNHRRTEECIMSP